MTQDVKLYLLAPSYIPACFHVDLHLKTVCVQVCLCFRFYGLSCKKRESNDIAVDIYGIINKGLFKIKNILLFLAEPFSCLP